jgi:hypothetical protein
MSQPPYRFRVVGRSEPFVRVRDTAQPVAADTPPVNYG